jgi:hypothetical protein
VRARATRRARDGARRAVRRGEARAIASLVDAVAAPEPPLPPVSDTDAVEAFATWLAYAPRLNRAAFRVALRLVGAGDRRKRLARLERLGPLGEGLRAAAASGYYGDLGVLRVLGHDPVSRVAEARERRARQGSVA